MNEKLLEDIGLTEGETKVYLALLKLGTTKTGPLASKAKVSSSKVYKILDRLETKGLAGHVTKKKTKYFKAMEPKRVLEYVGEKEKQLQKKKALLKQMMPELESLQKEEKVQATMYEGYKSIKNFYMMMLDELKLGEEYHVLGAYYGGDAPGIKSFFHKFHVLRTRKRVRVKLLANHETKGVLVESIKKYAQIKFLPQYLVPNMTVVFYKKKAFLFFLTDNPYGFLIEAKEVVQSFKAYFDTLWKIAKK